MIIQLCCTVLHGFVTLPLPRHLFFFCSCPSFLDEPREETLATQANDDDDNNNDFDYDFK